jgi:hypothetical protein
MTALAEHEKFAAPHLFCRYGSTGDGSFCFKKRDSDYDGEVIQT